MSHFTVLVTGSNPEESLSPYHEFECTGLNDKYVQDVDITQDIIKEGTDENGVFDLKNGLSYHGLEDSIVSKESDIELEDDGDHKYGYAVVKDGKLVKAVNRTNPNSKWDWYTIGGRWTGYFKVKEIHLLTDHSKIFDEFGFSRSEFEKLVDLYKNDKPKFDKIVSKYGKSIPITEAVEYELTPIYPTKKKGEANFGYGSDNEGYSRADQLKKRDIDIEGMKLQAEEEAAEEFDKLNLIVSNLPLPESWESVRNRISEIQEARDFYHSQPMIKAMMADKHFMWCTPDEFYIGTGGREKYIKNAFCKSIVPYAILHNGEWFQKGDMGWFGVSLNEKTIYDHSAKFFEVWESLSDDTLVTIFDCHI